MAHEHEWVTRRPDANVEVCNVPGCTQFRGLGEPVESVETYAPVFEGDDCTHSRDGRHEFQFQGGLPVFCVRCTVTVRGLGAEREFALRARMREEWHLAERFERIRREFR